MTAIPFDTHEFVGTLRKAGVGEQAAVAHKNALINAAFATKADLNEMEHRVIAKVAVMLSVHALAQAALVVGLIELLSQ
uniref:DUF1640 domain-containing protein n=1 Tax=Candidatus Kentrum sp. DK TaxID=2126562 RepID=A0A450SUJ8_9GAMM|nr:MAG: hypothetical protein BECKDK2373B_GA0170837_10682 [Candidatus Kentron sp. DK]